jgi:hypothetical protein
MNWFKTKAVPSKEDNLIGPYGPIRNTYINREPLAGNAEDDINFKCITIMEKYLNDIKTRKLVVNRIDSLSMRDGQFSTFGVQLERIGW